MIHRILLILALLIPIPSFAISTNNLEGFSSLSPADQAEFAKQIAIKAEAASKTKVPTIEAISEYADLGKQIGSVLSTVAHELGIATNEFAKTPVGILTVGLILWHFVGGTVLALTLGSAFLVIVVPLWYKVFKRVAFEPRTDHGTSKNITQTLKQKTWYGREVEREMVVSDFNAEPAVFMLMLLIVICAVDVILIVNLV